MNRCWPEGALRAHLDRELAPEEMERLTAHLGECAECARRSAELAARAQRVGAWMESLPAPPMEWVRPAPRPVAWPRKWIGVAAALAAGIVLAVWLLPKHPNPVPAPAPEVAVTPPAPAPEPVEPPAVVPEPVPVRTAAVPPKVRPARLPVVRTVSNDFLALDDEPLETGVVMRVGLEPGNVQADVIFGPDGRAHAIRLVETKY